MADWQDDIVDDVDDALGEWGSQDATVIYTQASQGAFNPVTGTYEGGETPESVRVKAIFAPVNQHFVDGQNTLASDCLVRMSPKGLSVLPSVGDTIRHKEKTYKIIFHRHAQPADKPLVLVYQVRAV